MAAAAAAASSAPQSATVAAKKQSTLQYIADHRNAGTKKTYAAGWKGFAEYLRKEKIAEAELSEWDVAGYLRRRVEDGVAASTISIIRSAIADHLKHTPLKHVTSALVVTEMMGVLRTQAAPSKPKRHMAPELMREIIMAHDAKGASGKASAWLDERDVCLMLLMMMAFLREGEATALTLSDIEVKTTLVHGVPRRVMHVFVARSKTDQERVGYVVLIGENSADPAVCPVRRLERYLAARAKAELPAGCVSLFPTVKGAEMASHTPCGLVQKAVRAANAVAEAKNWGPDRWGEPESYGSHSLRRGGVTTARANGASMLDIQKHGRWKSLTVFSYVGTTPEEQLAVTDRFLAAGTRVAAAAAAAAAATAKPKDAVPSPQAHALKAAGKPAAKAKAQSKKKRRAAQSDSESSASEGDDDESDSEEQKTAQALEDAMFEEQLGQGVSDEEEKKNGKRTAFRRVKHKAAAAAAEAKEKVGKAAAVGAAKKKAKSRK